MGKYYDSWESNRLIELKDEYPYQALQQMENYISRYPKDYYLRARYIGVLIDIGNLDQAESVLNELEKETNNDIDYLFANGLKKRTIFFHSFYYSKMRLLMFKYNDPEKAYDIFKTKWAKVEFDSDELKSFQIFYEININKKEYPKDYYNGCLLNQIIDYDEEMFYDHVKEHMYQDPNNKNHSVFVEDIPLKKIISEVKGIIPCDKRNYYGLIEDRYVFKYDDCGREGNSIVNYFMIAALHETQKFITMYPFRNQQGYPSIDLNYLKEKDVRDRPNMIDRFNRRLAKKKN